MKLSSSQISRKAPKHQWTIFNEILIFSSKLSINIKHLVNEGKLFKNRFKNIFFNVLYCLFEVVFYVVLTIIGAFKNLKSGYWFLVFQMEKVTLFTCFIEEKKNKSFWYSIEKILQTRWVQNRWNQSVHRFFWNFLKNSLTTSVWSITLLRICIDQLIKWVVFKNGLWLVLA